MLIWFVALAVLGIAAHPARAGGARRARPAATPTSSSAATARSPSSCSARSSSWSPAARRSMPTWAISAAAPIRLAWFALVLPALVLNYFGQGALVLSDPGGSRPAVLPARAALGALPAGRARHDGDRDRLAGGDLRRVLADPAGGPAAAAAAADDPPHPQRGTRARSTSRCVNWLLMIATIGLVLGFRSSGNLAAAYGVAISTDMVITTVLAFFVATRWGWNLWRPACSRPLSDRSICVLRRQPGSRSPTAAGIRWSWRRWSSR